MAIDVVLGWVIRGITADICVSFPLVHANVVDLHDCREDHGGQVNALPVALSKVDKR